LLIVDSLAQKVVKFSLLPDEEATKKKPEEGKKEAAK
jgi:hypothetical protein